MGICEAEFELKFKVKTNKNRILETTITEEAPVNCHSRVEECHGYHTFYDIDDRDYERKHQELIEEFNDLEILQESLLDELAEDEEVIEILAEAA
jgi:hypothetical protein